MPDQRKSRGDRRMGSAKRFPNIPRRVSVYSLPETSRAFAGTACCALSLEAMVKLAWSPEFKPIAGEGLDALLTKK